MPAATSYTANGCGADADLTCERAIVIVETSLVRSAVLRSDVRGEVAVVRDSEVPNIRAVSSVDDEDVLDVNDDSDDVREIGSPSASRTP